MSPQITPQSNSTWRNFLEIRVKITPENRARNQTNECTESVKRDLPKLVELVSTKGNTRPIYSTPSNLKTNCSKTNKRIRKLYDVSLILSEVA